MEQQDRSADRAAAAEFCARHPFVVCDANGHVKARFSNQRCAENTAIAYKFRNGVLYITGTHIFRGESHIGFKSLLRIVWSTEIPEDWTNIKLTTMQ